MTHSEDTCGIISLGVEGVAQLTARSVLIYWRPPIWLRFPCGHLTTNNSATFGQVIGMNSVFAMYCGTPGVIVSCEKRLFPTGASPIGSDAGASNLGLRGIFEARRIWSISNRLELSDLWW